MQKNNQNKGGFTLIEVLVVVLIIGILSSVALSQYRRAVIKSHNANFKQDIVSIGMAQQIYMDTFNKCADSFNELDIGTSLSVETADPCGISHIGNDAMRSSGNYYIVINHVGNTCSITGAWKEGEYACTGFSYILGNAGDLTDKNDTLMCVEKGNAAKKGVFCSKLEHGSFVSTLGGWDWYSL